MGKKNQTDSSAFPTLHFLYQSSTFIFKCNEITDTCSSRQEKHNTTSFTAQPPLHFSEENNPRQTRNILCVAKIQGLGVLQARAKVLLLLLSRSHTDPSEKPIERLEQNEDLKKLPPASLVQHALQPKPHIAHPANAEKPAINKWDRRQNGQLAALPLRPEK